MTILVPAAYKILYSPAREKRGMDGWAIMEQQHWMDEADKAAIAGGIWYAVSTHRTKAGAEASLAVFEAKAKS
jgi:hypothetical protein